MKPTVSRSRHARGLTLIELLVVIAIIGILAAMVMPAFARAKLTGHRTVSRNNLKQLIHAYLMYENDHGFTIPYDATSKNSAWAAYFSQSESFGDRTLIAPLCQKPGQDGLGNSGTAWAFGTPSPTGQPNPTAPPSANTATIGQMTFQSVSGPPSGAGVGACIITVDLQPGQPVYFLAMVENAARVHHTLAVFQPTASPVWNHLDYVKQQPISAIPGLKVGLNGDGLWEMHEWKGPLCKRLAGSLGRTTTGGLSEVGTYPSETYQPHTTPVGLATATSLGRGQPTAGIVFPNGYNGMGDNNFIYMGTWLESATAMTVKIAVAGDDVLGVFIGTPAAPGVLPPPIVVPAPAPQPVSGSYSINAWAQAFNPRSLIVGDHVFYTQAEQGDSRVPVFAEGIWDDLLAQPDDPIPTHTDGVDAGLGRVYLDRYSDKRNNIAFMDGHVEGVKLNALWASPWHRKWPQPAR